MSISKYKCKILTPNNRQELSNHLVQHAKWHFCPRHSAEAELKFKKKIKRSAEKLHLSSMIFGLENQKKTWWSKVSVMYIYNPYNLAWASKSYLNSLGFLSL